MIRIMLGNVGSGKTASVVREMRNNPHKNYITNIDVKGKDFKHVLKLKAENIIKRELISTKRDGTPVYKLELNIEFWKNLITKYRSMNVVIDEAHTLINPRRSGSSVNIVMTDWFALLRRVLGSQDGTGELILITQLSRRLDIIAKEMATEVTYCKSHYHKSCKKCDLVWSESNETANKIDQCPICENYNIIKSNIKIEYMRFTNIEKFMQYYDYHQRSYFSRFLITDISSVFNNYNTLQFSDLLSNY